MFTFVFTIWTNPKMPLKIQIYALTHLQRKMIIWSETVNNMTLRYFTIPLSRCKCKMSWILLTFLHLNQMHSVPCKIPELKCPLHSLSMLPPPPPPPLPPPPPPPPPLAQQKYREISKMRYKKNGNLEFSIARLTQFWSMAGCFTGKCLPRQEQV